jgi:hypothetical protein
MISKGFNGIQDAIHRNSRLDNMKNNPVAVMASRVQRVPNNVIVQTQTSQEELKKAAA